MTAEQIVRALAATDPVSTDGVWIQCKLCYDDHAEGRPLEHEPECPWRLAVEWVAEQDAWLARWDAP